MRLTEKEYYIHTNKNKEKLKDNELEKILTIIQTQPVGGDDTAKLLLKLVADSISLEKLQLITDTTEKKTISSPTKHKKEEAKKVGIIHFSKKKLECMPKTFKDIFAANDKIVRYRHYEGLYQARYRREGYNIEVASKDYETMKQKFIERLIGKVEHNLPVQKRNPLFSDYSEEWLKLKQKNNQAKHL